MKSSPAAMESMANVRLATSVAFAVVVMAFIAALSPVGAADVDAPADYADVGDAPADYASADYAAVGAAPDVDAPADYAPADDAPADYAAVGDAPVDASDDGARGVLLILLSPLNVFTSFLLDVSASAQGAAGDFLGRFKDEVLVPGTNAAFDALLTALSVFYGTVIDGPLGVANDFSGGRRLMMNAGELYGAAANMG